MPPHDHSHDHDHGSCGGHDHSHGHEEEEAGVMKQIVNEGDKTTFPKPGDNLTMHYTGVLADTGEKFDSSHDRKRPFQFQIGVGQVIRGWDEGVMTMSLGEKCILHIKSEFGYGAHGAGGKIPPNADLIFEVELLAINDVVARKRAPGVSQPTPEQKKAIMDSFLEDSLLSTGSKKKQSSGGNKKNKKKK